MKTAGAQPVARISDMETPDVTAIKGGHAGASEKHSSQPGQPVPAQDFHQLLEALIPRLTRYARVLTHDIVAADDLVQECLTRALGKMHLWEEGTDLRAWLFTILHHQYVSLTRRQARQRAGAELQKSYRSVAVSPNQTVRLELRDLERALAALPEEQRSVILLVGLEGMQYDEAASLVNLPVGTVRSRVSRGRETLRRMTEFFPGRHSPRLPVPAGLNSPRRPAPDGDHFRPIPAKPISASSSQEVRR
jgi:RNA polymerase sigma-70 factor (ECF subfamily)